MVISCRELGDKAGLSSSQARQAFIIKSWFNCSLTPNRLESPISYLWNTHSDSIRSEFTSGRLRFLVRNLNVAVCWNELFGSVS